MIEPCYKCRITETQLIYCKECKEKYIKENLSNGGLPQYVKFKKVGGLR